MRSYLPFLFMLILLQLPTPTQAWWQDGGGNNGDPKKENTITKLARFGLYLIEDNKLFPRVLKRPAHLPKTYHDKNINLTEVYRRALVNLKTVPQRRSGIFIEVHQRLFEKSKKALVFDPLVLRKAVEKHGETGLVLTVVHKVFQTLDIPDTHIPFDKDGEITKHYFKAVAREDYLAWQKEQASNPFFSPSSSRKYESWYGTTPSLW